MCWGGDMCVCVCIWCCEVCCEYCVCCVFGVWCVMMSRDVRAALRGVGRVRFVFKIYLMNLKYFGLFCMSFVWLFNWCVLLLFLYLLFLWVLCKVFFTTADVGIGRGASVFIVFFKVVYCGSGWILRSFGVCVCLFFINILLLVCMRVYMIMFCVFVIAFSTTKREASATTYARDDLVFIEVVLMMSLVLCVLMCEECLLYIIVKWYDIVLIDFYIEFLSYS